MTEADVIIEKLRLRRAFERVGAEYFYETEADFAPFCRMKITWQRNYKWASFRVSDFLADAPAEALEELARRSFARLDPGTEVTGCPALTAWLTAPAFAETHRGTWLGRNRYSPVRGQTAEAVMQSLGRLIAEGKVPADGVPDFLAATGTHTRDVHGLPAETSCLMRAVILPAEFAEAPAEVQDDLLYYALVPLMAGFTPLFGDGADNSEVARRREAHPLRPAVKVWMEQEE